MHIWLIWLKSDNLIDKMSLLILFNDYFITTLVRCPTSIKNINPSLHSTRISTNLQSLFRRKIVWSSIATFSTSLKTHHRIKRLPSPKIAIPSPPQLPPTWKTSRKTTIKTINKTFLQVNHQGKTPHLISRHLSKTTSKWWINWWAVRWCSKITRAVLQGCRLRARNSPKASLRPRKIKIPRGRFMKIRLQITCSSTINRNSRWKNCWTHRSTSLKDSWIKSGKLHKRPLTKKAKGSTWKRPWQSSSRFSKKNCKAGSISKNNKWKACWTNTSSWSLSFSTTKKSFQIILRNSRKSSAPKTVIFLITKGK